MITHTTPTTVEKKVTLCIEDDGIKCSHLQDLVSGAADGDRLRGVRQASKVSLYTQPRSDAIVKRIFSRGEIDSERAVVKSALLHAASNLTPERMKRIGSPGRLAIQRLQQRAARPGRHDIKVSHVFSDIKLLANGGRKRSFLHSPTKPVNASSLLKSGAAGLVAAHGEHRIRLQDFCVIAGTLESLPVLLRQPQDQNQDLEKILCCIALFRALVSNFLSEEKNAHYADKNKLFDYLRISIKGDLPYLFIDRWQIARKNGLINEHSFEWVSAIDWLVNGLQPEKQARSRRVRKPKNARSPVTYSPASLPSQPQFSPLPVRQTSHSASFQPGRQAATMQMRRLPDSPSRLVLTAQYGADEGAVHRARKKRAAQSHGMNLKTARHNSDMPLVMRKTEKMAKVSNKRSTPPAAYPQQTLQDMLYLASIGKSMPHEFITVDILPLAVTEEENAET
jgi:hypothetical protein